LSASLTQTKDKSNIKKHKVSFEEASTTFGDPLSLTIFDERHSLREDRYITVGKSYTGKIMVVVHTDRGTNVRIISARLATRNEKKQYNSDKEL